VRGREAVEGQQVLLGLQQQLRDLRRGLGEPFDHLAAAARGLLVAVGVEDLPERGRDHPALGRPTVAQHVSDEVHGAALPRAAQHAGDRVLEPEVLVGDAQAHAGQAALAQRAQERDPVGLGLDLADVQADHLAPARLVHRVGDHQRLRVHVPAIPDLDHFRVQPQVGVRPLQRPLPERLHLVVEPSAQRRDAVLGHAVDPELLDQPVDLARGDAVDVGLHHDRDDRPLGAPTRLQKRRKVRLPRALLGDLQLDLADPRLPRARPVTVAVRDPLGADLTKPGTDLGGDLGVHQPRGNHRHRLLEKVAVLVLQRAAHELLGRHALPVGHRGVPFVSRLGRQPTSLGARGGRRRLRPRTLRGPRVTPLLPP
jgi:hypothetical protein